MVDELMKLDPEILAAARDARARMVDRQHELDRARGDFHHEIRRLHASGGSLREISEALGVSHQRVHQIVNEDGGGLAAALRRLGSRLRDLGAIARLSDEARAVIARSHAEAMAHGMAAVRSEHLLAALADPAAGPSARALAIAGVSHNAVRAPRDPRRKRRGRTSFSPIIKRVLERSVKEALARGEHHLGSEHLLLALLSESDRDLRSLFERLGVDPEAIRAALDFD